MYVLTLFFAQFPWETIAHLQKEYKSATLMLTQCFATGFSPSTFEANLQRNRSRRYVPLGEALLDISRNLVEFSSNHAVIPWNAHDEGQNPEERGLLDQDQPFQGFIAAL